MMGHTKAFATYRDLSQAHINFVVLACYAVPALRPEFSNLSTPLLHQPDHFKFNPESKRELAKYANSYQEVLARTTVMATFSYFESYVREAMSEVIQFHGGVEAFQKLAHDRAAKLIKRLQPDLEKSKRKLQEPAQPVKKEKYAKHSRLLDKGGFRDCLLFPLSDTDRTF